MTYPIFYSSRTGNTKILAQALAGHLKNSRPLEAEKADEKILSFLAENPSAPVFVGFWTDKGSCDSGTLRLLSRLHKRQILLFGTAGFGGSQSYFDQILSKVSALIPSDSQYLSGFMCQGKMPQTVRSRYEQLLLAAESDKDKKRFSGMIANFDRALLHPDDSDLAALLFWADRSLSDAAEQGC